MGHGISKGARVHGCKGARAQGYKRGRAQSCNGARMRKCKCASGSGVHGCKGACKSAKLNSRVYEWTAGLNVDKRVYFSELRSVYHNLWTLEPNTCVYMATTLKTVDNNACT